MLRRFFLGGVFTFLKYKKTSFSNNYLFENLPFIWKLILPSRLQFSEYPARKATLPTRMRTCVTKMELQRSDGFYRNRIKFVIDRQQNQRQRICDGVCWECFVIVCQFVDG